MPTGPSPRRGADRQLLPDGPGDRQAFRARHFLSDNRADLAQVKLPTLVLQCSDDPIAPDSVGEYVHAQVPGSTLVKLAATGHCPNLSAPPRPWWPSRLSWTRSPAPAFRAALVPHDLATVAFYAALADDDPAELYDNAPCGYLSTLPDGTVVKANATFLAWTGYDRDALIGQRRFQDLLSPGDRIFYQTHAAPLLLMQGMLREIAVQVISASGSRLPMLMNALLKRGEDGQPLIVRTVLFDASERLAYERELMAARRRAEESEARARVLAETLQLVFPAARHLRCPASTSAAPTVRPATAARSAATSTTCSGLARRRGASCLVTCAARERRPRS